MRRFSQAFLTIAAVLILLVNLVIILLYGRQFYACPGEGGCGSETGLAFDYVPFLAMNAIVLGTFLMIWLAFLYIRRHSS